MENSTNFSAPQLPEVPLTDRGGYHENYGLQFLVKVIIPFILAFVLVGCYACCCKKDPTYDVDVEGGGNTCCSSYSSTCCKAKREQ